MNPSIDLGELIAQVRKFCDEREWEPFHGPKDLAIGLVTEASELLEVFRFVPESEMTELLASDQGKESISDELADTLFFLLRFADLNGFCLKSALEAKLIKNAKKYPVDEFKGNYKKSNRRLSE